MTLVPPRGGEIVVDTPERYAEIKVGGDALSLVEFRYGPGRRGPDPHVHHHHADGFFVLDGEWTFELGPEREIRRGGPGTLVLFPPGFVHTFRNESPADARCLNIHAPSCGFHRYLRGEYPEFDQHEPPPDGGLPLSAAVISPDGTGSVEQIRGAVVELSPGSAWPRDGWLCILEGTLAGSVVNAGSLESKGHTPTRALHLVPG